ncbi:MarR family transcriptional regulator [Natrinema zhouii]|uniref:MarR family transcriptional regulator n=1 Tax=Natrinema zhouii TaxID=1710539 RepID=A0A7D6CSK2_9EURY|nr:helix-turn-helix domain-containing protein [Natrinema zhouii]QLK26891.1 MarR family transcriptional regulator [Natrinema zhouii]
MSIDIDRFNERSEEELEEMSNPERVLVFLFENDDRAWKATAIADRTDINRNSINTVLARLEERDLVRHKGSYWAITDDTERLRKAYDIHRANRLFNELYGAEDREEWVEHAADRDDR